MKKIILIITILLFNIKGYSQCPINININNDTLYLTWNAGNKPHPSFNRLEIDTFNGSKNDTISLNGTFTSGSIWTFKTYIGNTNLSINTIYNQLRFYNDSNYLSICNQSGALPVTLLYIKSYIYDTEVTIEWATSSEWNADFFLLEKKVNNLWFPICTIPCTNTNNIQKYFSTFTKHPNQEMIIRLSQHDLDKSVNILKHFSFKSFEKELPVLIKTTDIFGREVNNNNTNNILIIEFYENKTIKKLIIK